MAVEWFTVEDAAKLVDRNPRTIQRWVADGDIPARTVTNPDTGRPLTIVPHDGLLEADRRMNQRRHAVKNIPQ